MNRLRGALAGFVFGLLIAPIVGMVTYLMIFVIGLLSLTRNGFFEQVHRATMIIGEGHPVYWAVLTMVLSCLFSVAVGYSRDWQFFSATRTAS
jgi:ABC-type dipeptide/oligopeptide/nickel transport system permease component